MTNDKRRTIIDLRDVETGDYVNANDILDFNSEGTAMLMRETLVLSQKSGHHKYVCAVCGQPLKLCKKESWFHADELWYFSHFAKSDDCPVKTTTDITPSKWASQWAQRYKESTQHKHLCKTMKQLLDHAYGFQGTEVKQRISRPDILPDEYRVPDVYTIFHNKEIAIEFQLYSTFISTIVDRNSFYRRLGMTIMWIFPFFSTEHQKICEKDTYYSHRRNVFVFDSRSYYRNPYDNSDKPLPPINDGCYKFAQEESLRQRKLMLNCFWQEPYVQEGKVNISWHHKLVSIDDLTFDEETHEVFFKDSENMFYQVASDHERELYDKWKEAKEKRWELIFRRIELRKEGVYTLEDLAQYMKREEEQNYLKTIMKRLADGEITLEPFRNVNPQGYAGNWGYKYGEMIIIPPRFGVAEAFCGPVAPVKQRMFGHWGAIDVWGKKKIPFQYDDFVPIKPNLYLVSKSGKYGCIDCNNSIILPLKYTEIKPLGTNYLVLSERMSSYSSKHYILNLYDFSSREINDSKVKALGEKAIKVGGGTSWIIYNREKETMNDASYSSVEWLNGRMIASKNTDEGTKYGVLADDGSSVTYDFIIDEVKAFTDNALIYKKGGRYAYSLVNSMHQMSDFTFEQIKRFNDTHILVQHDGLVGILDNNFQEVLPIRYDAVYNLREESGFNDRNNRESAYCYFIRHIPSIAYYWPDCAPDNIFVVEKNRKYGICLKGTTLIPAVNEDIDFYKGGYIAVRRDGKWGLLAADGIDVLPCEYDTIGFPFNSNSCLEEYWRDLAWRETFKLKKEGKELIYNLKQGLLVPDIYDSIDFLSGMIKVSIHSWDTKRNWTTLYGLISPQGNVILPVEYDCIYSHPNTDGVFVKRFGKEGKLSSNGDIIYSEVRDFAPGLKAKEYTGWGLFTDDGREVIPCRHAGLYSTSIGLILYTEYICGRKKWGLYDMSGNLLTDPIYNSAAENENGTLDVETDYGTGTLDASGTIIPINICPLDERYSIGWSCGYCAIIDKDSLHNYTPYEFKSIEKPSNTTILATKTISTHRGEEQNKMLLGLDLRTILSQVVECKVIEGFVLVKCNKYSNSGSYETFHIVNREGTQQFQEGFEEVSVIQAERDMLFIVSSTTGMGVLDNQGAQIFPLVHKHIEWVKDEMIFKIQDIGFDLYTSSGVRLTKQSYTSIEYLSPGRFLVSDAGDGENGNLLSRGLAERKVGVVNLSGDYVLPVVFIDIIDTGEYYEACQVVKPEESCLEKEQILWMKYDYDGNRTSYLREDLSEDLIKEERFRGLWYIGNRKGDHKSLCCYDEIIELSLGILKVSQNGLFGIIDSQEGTILPITFDDIRLQDDVFQTEKADKKGCFSLDGQIVPMNKTCLIENLFIGEHLGYKGVLDSEGKMLLGYCFTDIYPLGDSHFVAKGRIKCGEEVFPCCIYDKNIHCVCLISDDSDTFGVDEDNHLYVCHKGYNLPFDDEFNVLPIVCPLGHGWYESVSYLKHALCTESGELLTSYEFDKFTDIQENNLIAIGRDGSQVITPDGRTILKASVIKRFRELYICKYGSCYGMYQITEDGSRNVLPCIFTEIKITGEYNCVGTTELMTRQLLEFFSHTYLLNHKDLCNNISFDFKKGLPNLKEEAKPVVIGKIDLTTIHHPTHISKPNKVTRQMGVPYKGRITGIQKYGVFVDIPRVGSGLLHKSEIKKARSLFGRYEKGQEIIVFIKKVKSDNKIELSLLKT